MEAALQLNTQRLKCGEVFVWDCVGELFAIECWLCEERPLCALTEFAEHMDVWHSDWIAEAYATLLDTTTTTTTATGEYELFPKCGAPNAEHINECTTTEQWRVDACSESDNFENVNSEHATLVDMEVEVEAAAAAVAVVVTESGSEHDSTIVLEATANAELQTGVCTTEPYTTEPYTLGLQRTEGELCETRNDTEFVAQVQKSGTTERRATSANTANVSVRKRVENSIEQRLKTDKLIQIYERFPELWHKEQRSQLKTDTQSKAYHSISRELNEHGINLKASVVQRRLNALRKLFRLEKLEELKGQLKGRTHESTFEYYAQLQFLKDHIEPQLCKVCKRICKNATECCGGTEEDEKENIDGIELREDADKAEIEGEQLDLVEEEEHTVNVEVAEEEKVQDVSELAEQATETLAVEEITISQEVEEVHESAVEAPPANMQTNESELGSTEQKTTAELRNVNQAANEDICEPINNLEGDKIELTMPANPSWSTLSETMEPNQPTAICEPINILKDEQIEFTLSATLSETAEPLLPASPSGHILTENDESIATTSTSESVVLGDSEPVERVTRSKRNKIEILEVLELPKIHNFNTHQPEVSTSTSQQEVGGDSNFDAVNNSDELIVSEEYDSSNGDSGILRDCDENNTAKIESFARLTTEQTHKLIQLFGKYPMLWDPDHTDFRLRERRRRAWREMTVQINELYGMHYTWVTLHRKMNDYIKYYRRERRRIELEGGSTRWCFYDDFTFLAGVLVDHSISEPKQLWGKQQNLKIIEVYAAHPQLWNIEHPDFKRRRLRQSFFRVMSEHLCAEHGVNLDPAKVKQRVAELRCAFRLEKERRTAAAQKGEIYESSYDYYQQLSFLEPHIAPFTCSKCDVQYKKHSELDRHKRREHSNKNKPVSLISAPPTVESKKPDTLENICYICGMSFKLSRSLACHLKRHTNQRKYHCSQCPKRFFDGASLRLHERSHTKSRPYVCDQCGKSYVSGGKLNQHMKRHTGQRDYPCEICDKAFYSSFECERHMRTHMNIREKVCTICGKDFGVGSSYYAHMLLHSDVKKYQCKMCCKQFAQFAGLYKHRRRYHPTEFASERAKKNISVASDAEGCAN